MGGNIIAGRVEGGIVMGVVLEVALLGAAPPEEALFGGVVEGDIIRGCVSATMMLGFHRKNHQSWTDHLWLHCCMC